MRPNRSPLLGLIALSLAAAVPAVAQLDTRYEGTQLVDGKHVPASTEFAVDKDRVAAVFKGARSSRMIYERKGGVLRLIDDDSKSWFDLAENDRNRMTDAMAQMQKQMAQMPAGQREMAEKMMGGMLSSMSSAPPAVYVRSTDTLTVMGYTCTRVDVMRGDEKRAEYWGTTSPDFELTSEERATRIAMQGAMGAMNVFARAGGPGGGETRPFEWDTKLEGYPLISRCFDGGTMTLDLHLVSFDRKPLDPVLFEVPKGYTQQELHGDLGGRGRGHKN